VADPNDLGIPLVLIKDSFEEPPPPEYYLGTDCLTYGMYGEIRHNGDVQLCSDSYSDPAYAIVNLFDHDLSAIGPLILRLTLTWAPSPTHRA
jgi:hypothetical protein